MFAGLLPRPPDLRLRHLHLPFKPDELYRVPTDDGASIALGRYHPRGERRFMEPVILCHGLGTNRYNLDLDEKYSLARYLARAGHETWVLELRGRGLAGGPIEATFDDQAEFDVRAAIRTVLGTGAKQVNWVGHSKGGLVAYGHLARNPEAPIRALVALGSPASFAVQSALPKFLDRIAPLLSMKSIPMSRVGQLAFLGPPPGGLTPYMLRAANVDPEIMKRAMFNMASDIPGGVARQFAQWIRTGKFDSADGKFDYRKNMAAIKIPILLIAGSHDLLAPPLAVARAQEWVSGPVKLLVAGKAHGFHEDYGHGDLAIGKKAPDEIFPLVEDFFETHGTRA